VAAVIIFAIIFTAGFSYFSFQSASNFALDKANASAQSTQNHVNQESLVLGVFQSPSSSNLWLNITNVGGGPSTIVSVFVTNSAGQLVSSGPTSPYLIGSPDLNVTLPIAIPVGTSTHAMKQDIAITSAGFAYSSGTVIVSVLTASGNEFSAQYPSASIVSTTTITTDTTVTTTSSTATTLTIGSSTTSTSVSTSSSTISSGIALGTNALVVQMSACPWSGSACLSSSGFYGGTVLATVTVTNYASQTINTAVNVLPVVTGTVPAPTGGCSPSSQNIAGNGGSSTFQCTYSVSQGNVGGTVTFIGYAQGTAGGKQITSAEATSNTINVGNLATELTGPLTIDYFDFAHYSSTYPSGSSSPIISHSEHFVSLDATITNTGNASIMILQYSYFQFVRTAQEEDYYIVSGSPTYSGSTHTFSALQCTDAPPSAPSPSGCGIELDIGETSTVAFAASSPAASGASSGSGWEWGSGTPGGGISQGEGINGFVVIIFAEQNAAGNWVSFAQTLPYYGIYIS